MARMQSMTGTNRTHILRSKQFPLLHRLHHKERPAEHAAALLFLAKTKVDLPQSLFGHAHGGYHLFKFVRLKREGGIRPRLRTRQCEMLFDDASPQRYRGDWNRRSYRVIGKPHRDAEAARQFRN